MATVAELLQHIRGLAWRSTRVFFDSASGKIIEEREELIGAGPQTKIVQYDNSNGSLIGDAPSQAQTRTIDQFGLVDPADPPANP